MAERGPKGDRGSLPDAAWWQGRRGEWYVVVQFLLFALVVAGPTTAFGWPARPFPGGLLTSVGGGVLLAFGAVLAIAGARQHGSGLQALPYPRDGGTVLFSGPYRIVRHPIYSGALFMAFGWALWRSGWLTFVYAALLFLLFDAKARLEERWLVEKFPSYAEYRRRVRKLVPFLY
jgi:protein-S-isoprenylcysteine O-methyltransferase Ste14